MYVEWQWLVMAAIALGGLWFAATRDMRDRVEQAERRYNDMERQYLASEQARTTVMHENLDLIKESLAQDRENRDLRDELRRRP